MLNAPVASGSYLHNRLNQLQILEVLNTLKWTALVKLDADDFSFIEVQLYSLSTVVCNAVKSRQDPFWVDQRATTPTSMSRIVECQKDLPRDGLRCVL